MSEPAIDDEQGLGRKQLNRIVDRFMALGDERLTRIRVTLTHEQRSFFDLMPLLWHVNNPMLPGFVSTDTPARTVNNCCWQGAMHGASAKTSVTGLNSRYWACT